jgi:ribosomal protein L17
MNIRKKVVTAVVGGLTIAGFVAATALALPQISSAQTETPAAGQAVPPANAPLDRMGPGGPAGNQDKTLADALGITQDQLAAARTKAREAAIAQAVKAGLITQAQADAMLNKTGADLRGLRIDLRGAKGDQEKYLADALGISVEKLQAAEETAAKAELAQAVTDGRITQAQADQITAERALQKYITDKGFFKSAVDSAVSAGVITQAQADAILSKVPQGGFGFGFGPGDMGGFGGPGGRGGHGGGRGPELGGAAPAAPAAPPPAPGTM